MKNLKFISIKFKIIYPRFNINNISQEKINPILKVYYFIATVHRYNNRIRYFEKLTNLLRT